MHKGFCTEKTTMFTSSKYKYAMEIMLVKKTRLTLDTCVIAARSKIKAMNFLEKLHR
jgi:hypothetical protein